MPRVRKVQRNPSCGTNFYLVDACFLANRYIPSSRLNPQERIRVERCNAWWEEIYFQLRANKAIVIVPDICIAEAFKVLAKKYYKDKHFTSREYLEAKKKFASEIQTSQKMLKLASRKIFFHDISTSRDIIISVDRFLEAFMKHGLHKVSLPDLIILATAKYLIDFYKIPKENLHIVTIDGDIHKGSHILRDIPTAYNPLRQYESAQSVFID